MNKNEDIAGISQEISGTPNTYSMLINLTFFVRSTRMKNICKNVLTNYSCKSIIKIKRKSFVENKEYEDDTLIRLERTCVFCTLPHVQKISGLFFCYGRKLNDEIFLR